MGLSLLLAVGIILSMLVSRRTLRGWQEHYTAENRQWKQQDEEGIVYASVTPEQADFYDIVDESTEGSGYLAAEELTLPEQITRRTIKNPEDKWKEI